MKNKFALCLILGLLLSLISPPTLAASIPPWLTYQGHLLDADGVPVPDGPYTLGFSLWDTATAGTQLWGPETHDVPVEAGYFAVILGEQIPLPPFTSAPLYLELTVGGTPLTPRQRLTAVAFALNASTLDGQSPDYYRDWNQLTGVPPGFADGIDHDTRYTDSDALAAVQAAGYVTPTQMIAALLDTQSRPRPVAYATAAGNAATLDGYGPDYYRDWAHLTGVPTGFADGVDHDTVYTDSDTLAAVAAAGYLHVNAVPTVVGTAGFITGASLTWANLTGIPSGFADGVDHDTVYTDTDALAAVAHAGYLTPTTALHTVATAGYVRSDQLATLISDTGTLTVTVSYATAAGNATTLAGHAGSYYLDVTHVTTGTLDPARYSAVADLTAEGYLDGDGASDLVTYGQGDARYVNTGAAGSVTGAMLVDGTVTAADLQDGATLAELLDDDGATSGLDADLLDGQQGSYYRNASHLNAGTLDPGYYSAIADLAAEGYLDNNAAGDLLTQGQGDSRYVNVGESNSVTSAMLVNGAVTSSDLQDGAALADLLDDDGSGSGLDADLLDGQSGTYYRSWTNLTNVPTGFADGVDNVGPGDITAVTAGTGLTGGGTSGSVTLNADPTYVQRRVSSTCAPGSSIRAIHADGTVTCESDDAGDPPAFLPRDNQSTALGVSGFRLAATLGADGLPLVAYGNGPLYLAFCTDAACTSTSHVMLDPANSLYPAITVGPDGCPVVSYYSIAAQDLRVAHCADARCTTVTRSTVDATGQVGYFSDIVIGRDGLPVISYIDYTHYDLKVAHCDAGACTSATLTTLDSAATADGQTAMALGVDGLPLIAYFNGIPAYDLKVAHCEDVACTSATLTTVDSAGYVGVDTAVTIGADGLPLISYGDDTNKDLKVAHCADVACSSATVRVVVDNPTFKAHDTAITVGADGLPLIAYHRYESRDLAVVHCGDVTCATATQTLVATTGTTGMDPAVLIGADALPFLVYIDAGNSNALVATHCANAFCVPYWQR